MAGVSAQPPELRAYQTGNFSVRLGVRTVGGGGVRRLLCSGQVLVQVGVVGVTLEVLTRDEVLDALLDLRG